MRKSEQLLCAGRFVTIKDIFSPRVHFRAHFGFTTKCSALRRGEVGAHRESEVPEWKHLELTLWVALHAGSF